MANCKMGGLRFGSDGSSMVVRPASISFLPLNTVIIYSSNSLPVAKACLHDDSSPYSEAFGRDCIFKT